MNKHCHLHRLTRIHVPNAVYFITVCAQDRRAVLKSDIVSEVLVNEWRDASSRHGWLIGRYVIMPDHVHFFCAEQAMGASKSLSQFMNYWKEWTAKGIAKAAGIRAPIWQRQFFDHVLRSNESYADKWMYVRENPVRAGLVARSDEWPYQGYIHFDSPRPACAATEE